MKTEALVPCCRSWHCSSQCFFFSCNFGCAPKKYLYSLYRILFSGSMYPLNISFNYENRSTGSSWAQSTTSVALLSVLLCLPTYRLGHLDNYVFSFHNIMFMRSKCPKKQMNTQLLLTIWLYSNVMQLPFGSYLHERMNDSIPFEIGPGLLSRSRLMVHSVFVFHIFVWTLSNYECCLCMMPCCFPYH